jgi:hypothetical protein
MPSATFPIAYRQVNLVKFVGHQTAVYAGGELLGGEVNEQEEKNELDSVNWCCKTATFFDAYI